MSARARLLLERAHTALSTARRIVDEDPVGAANRTYYAAFDAARAALATTGEAPRSHMGVKRRFALHFVRTGRISAEVARALGSAEELRLLADYDEGATIEADDVRAVRAAVEGFIEAVEAVIGSEHPPGDAGQQPAEG